MVQKEEFIIMNAKTDTCIFSFANLRYWRLKLLKYKENKKTIDILSATTSKMYLIGMQ